MIEAKYNLVLAKDHGKKVIREGRGRNTFLERGKLLAMTANEAVEFGLATALRKTARSSAKSWATPSGRRASATPRR